LEKGGVFRGLGASSHRRLRRRNTFFKTLILMVLLCKTIKISVLKNILWRRQPPKDFRKPLV